MSIHCHKRYVKLTLFFFVVMVCHNPALAQQFQSVVPDASFQVLQNSLPVTYIAEEQSAQVKWELQRRGYKVREGTLEQLAQLEQQVENNAGTKESEKIQEEKKCINPETGEAIKCKQTEPGQSTEPGSESNSSHVPQPGPSPATVHTQAGVYVDLPVHGGSGNANDVAKVLFIVAGVVVVAAFIVYAGKYITDIVSGEEKELWWELIFNSTFFRTDSGQHGRLLGAKVATGFVSSDLIQVALVGEFGNTDLELLLNDNASTVNVDVSGSYWLMGATARLHLTDKLVNASYLYMDFMGGATSNNVTGNIGMARLGASFGINDYMRLGANIGAHYIGLEEDQGFVNDGDNYWFTYGLEMGVKF